MTQRNVKSNINKHTKKQVLVMNTLWPKNCDAEKPRLELPAKTDDILVTNATNKTIPIDKREILQAATLEWPLVPLPSCDLLPAQTDQEGEPDSTRRTVSAVTKVPDVALPPWNYYANLLARLWPSASCEQLDVVQPVFENPPAESLWKKK